MLKLSVGIRISLVIRALSLVIPLCLLCLVLVLAYPGHDPDLNSLPFYGLGFPIPLQVQVVPLSEGEAVVRERTAGLDVAGPGCSLWRRSVSSLPQPFERRQGTESILETRATSPFANFDPAVPSVCAASPFFARLNPSAT